MNAIFYIITMLSGLFGMQFQTGQVEYQGQLPINSKDVKTQTYGLDQINVNPRTVVVLEDTHFKPAK